MSTRSPRPRRIRRRTLLALLLLPFVAELGLRVVARLAHMQRGMEFHADYGWRPVPGVKKKGRYWGGEELAWTNSRGWRDAEVSASRAPGDRRIVALGDSFTFGVQVDYGERFSERLEETVDGLEVVNLGVTGYGTDQQLRVLEVEGFGYEPDLVLLVSFLSNDLDDIQYWRNLSWPKPWYERRGEELILHRPKASWGARVRSASYLGEILARTFERSRQHWSFTMGTPLADPAEHYVALVKRMQQLCDERDVPLVVVLAYAMGRREHGPTPREEMARDGLAQAGVEVIDSLDLFEDERHYAEDGHWNAEGHRVLAQRIAQRLVLMD